MPQPQFTGPWWRILERALTDFTSAAGEYLKDLGDPQRAPMGRRVEGIETRLAGIMTILSRMEAQMKVDTSGILAAVAKVQGENASLRSLMTQTHEALVGVKAALAEALANNNDENVAKIQEELDKATDLLNIESKANRDAIEANDDDPNTPAKPAEPAPAAPVDSTGSGEQTVTQ